MNNTFTGKRVRIRAWEPEDIDYLLGQDRARDTEMDRMVNCTELPRAAWKLRGEFPNMMSSCSSMEDFRFLIEELEEHKVVGIIRAHSVDVRMGQFSYGLSVDESYRRMGYASEAILLLLRYYFMELRMHKCNVAAYAFNEASIALHDKLGFVREGLRRDAVYTHGMYWDQIEFGMTKQEFEEKHKEFSQEG